MAEQIIHKKTIKRLDKDKRQLLKQYYQLDSSPDNPSPQNKPQTKKKLPDHQTNSQEQPNNPEESPAIQTAIADSTLTQLLHSHNILLTRETAANNSIKNTIYDNYYDLIKVNHLLGEMANSTMNHELEVLAHNVKLIRK
ncbi:Vps51p Ecym_6334 [Eremothecium cymbalariae DBVPG|uniref:Vacuolar protein sorting-associated protein 51 homolog n=1 Tax=Eremothecium cymbalariae (strain CBS 270.75 / DBVPG 7215 / KCTC 17166 / NRRL Y-17582) TaxID=931890 RepID=G8JUD0_ERECY|nr:hypothetical protein Ecym_6334 [Eremothecium cymbalariae DBVPG\